MGVERTDTPRRPATAVATVVAGLGGVAFVVLALLLVPSGIAVDPVPAQEIFTSDEIDRAEDFRAWGRLWSWSSLAVSLAVACWLGFGRTGPRMVGRLRGPWWLRAVLAVGLLVAIGRVVTLPFAIALRSRSLEEGLATSSWPAWAGDVAKGELVEIAVTGLAVVALLGCARRWRRAWPAVAGALLAGLVVVGSFAYPLLVEPLFNDFEPLPAGELRTDIVALAEAEGVEVDEVLVADASRRTTTLNAYVSGFGGTRRVVVYDNLVADLAHDEALVVVAHELAHAKHDDVIVGTALGAAGSFVGAGLLGLALAWLGRRGRPAIEDVRVVPLLLALVTLASLASAPIENGISRRMETRADVTALEAVAGRDGAVEAFESMQRRLALRSLADPTPPAWSQWWFGSHPTVLERIGLARSSQARDPRMGQFAQNGPVTVLTN